jgi:uncharacterized membrane protein YbhN (UPF0104 family)
MTVPRFFLKLLISACLVAVALRNADASALLNHLAGASVPAIVLGAMVMAALAALPAQRWRTLVRLGGADFSLGRLYRLVMIGNFFGQAIPVVGADGVRAWYLYRNGVPTADAILSVLLDRLSALAATLLLVALSFPWLWAIVPRAVAWVILAFMLASAAGATVLLAAPCLLPALLGPRRKIGVALQRLAQVRDALWRSPRALLAVIGLSLIVQVAMALFVYAIARSAGVPVAMWDCVLLVPLVMLASMLPIGIAGWGIREGSMVVAFGYLNIPNGDALLVSVFFGIILAISSLPGLAFWLLMGRELRSGTGSHG